MTVLSSGGQFAEHGDGFLFGCERVGGTIQLGQEHSEPDQCRSEAGLVLLRIGGGEFPANGKGFFSGLQCLGGAV